MVQLGCESLATQPPAWLRTKRLGLLSNQASVTHRFEHVIDVLTGAGGKLHCLFSPQHGFFGEKQANMRESPDDWDRARQIPMVSLYSNVRRPPASVLQNIDVLLVDLQDVGTRVYTYTTTMGLCMEAAAELGVKVVILDRPNPINGKAMEGNLLSLDCRSFVGRYPVPMRHGLTIGEFALFVAGHCNIPCDLEVIPMHGWQRRSMFSGTHLPWVFPSPNMPTWETALLYPGMVLLEGINVSEGRGTTLPFQLFGAPFIDQKKLARSLDPRALRGIALRPATFEPMFDKWRGQTCYGFQIHVTDPDQFRPYRFGLALLQSVMREHPGDCQWLPPPYEYEYEKLPIDIILGSQQVRKAIEQGVSLDEVEHGWAGDIEAFQELRKDCLLYGDGD